MNRRIPRLLAPLTAALLFLQAAPASAADTTPSEGWRSLNITSVKVNGSTITVGYDLPDRCPWTHTVETWVEMVDSMTAPAVRIRANGTPYPTLMACAQVITPVTMQVTVEVPQISQVLDVEGNVLWKSAPPDMTSKMNLFTFKLTSPKRGLAAVEIINGSDVKPAKYTAKVTRLITKASKTVSSSGRIVWVNGLVSGSAYRVAVTIEFEDADGGQTFTKYAGALRIK